MTGKKGERARGRREKRREGHKRYTYIPIHTGKWCRKRKPASDAGEKKKEYARGD